ncbi:hypothetical protein BYT27DRAFT_6755845 [Phlegmacium glaucopus]|nr:hypothetical protein BYT27DRAFT_6755845 [Phlegmacium glaucopus]
MFFCYKMDANGHRFAATTKSQFIVISTFITLTSGFIQFILHFLCFHYLLLYVLQHWLTVYSHE